MYSAAATTAASVNYSYDGAGRLIKAKYDNGNSITYIYDENGNLLKRTLGSSDDTPGDIDNDGDVDVDDIMNIADRWNSDGDYDEKYDMDKDGDIDVIDVMIACSNWTGSSQETSTAITRETVAAKTKSLETASKSQVSLVKRSDRTVCVMGEGLTKVVAFEIKVQYDGSRASIKEVMDGAMLVSGNYSFLGPKFGNDFVIFGYFSIGNNQGLNGDGELAIIEITGDPAALETVSIHTVERQAD